MSLNLADKLKSLRKEKNISQEKLAQYLNVSVQAVSKWENSNTYPDISLLPEIARFFGITIDELLQVEIIDEKRLYHEYKLKTTDLYRIGKVSDTVPIWQEALHKMPNNINVKEMLMSAYFDTDKIKYQSEIIELGTEIFNSDASVYYKGQAIEQIARTYAANNNVKMSERWASKAFLLMHSQEIINMQILKDGNELIEQFSFANYWYFKNLFFMSARISACDNIPGGIAFTQAVNKNVAQIYEIIYPNDDMPFEDLKILCELHRSIAEDEISLNNDKNIVKHHLTRAFECAKKSLSIKEHKMSHPLVFNRYVYDAPSDNKQIILMLKKELTSSCFDEYRTAEWYAEIDRQLEKSL